MTAPATSVRPRSRRAREPRSEVGLQSVLNAIGVAVYTTDATGTITYFNEAAASFWGRRPRTTEKWCGSHRLFFRDGRPMPHDECPMAIAITENRAIHGAEAQLERPDGTRGAFLAYPTPLHDAAGTAVGAINVLVDVTQRRKAEEALRAAAESLAASNVVKDEFLGLVSHELRTPVTTIFGNAQLLRAKPNLKAEDRQSMLVDIADESSRLLGIIENLLLLTRLESGADRGLEPQLVPHIVRSAVEDFGRNRPARKVALRIEPGQMVVEADQSHLEMLVNNLLTNAAKYSPADSPIEVTVASVDDEVTVTVLDRGIGIGEADVEKLFTAFYRSESAKNHDSGLGIGLAVCRRIVESLGGRIWLTPRKGGGTEAGFALPVAEVEPD
ncbi:MAG: ATP-binding protein [Chloroflexota bacterium]